MLLCARLVFIGLFKLHLKVGTQDCVDMGLWEFMYKFVWEQLVLV